MCLPSVSNLENGNWYDNYNTFAEYACLLNKLSIFLPTSGNIKCSSHTHRTDGEKSLIGNIQKAIALLSLCFLLAGQHLFDYIIVIGLLLVLALAPRLGEDLSLPQ